jgi:Tetratricopeptide repeat
MSYLAATYQNQGRWKNAEELEVLVMEARKRVLGEEHPHILDVMSYLAATYRNLGRMLKSWRFLSWRQGRGSLVRSILTHWMLCPTLLQPIGIGEGSL